MVENEIKIPNIEDVEKIVGEVYNDFSLDNKLTKAIISDINENIKKLELKNLKIKNVQFISIADLLIDYVKHLSNPFFEINQNIYIKNKIFKFYGEKASQAFDEKPFFNFSQNIDIDFNLCFLLKKKDDFIFFQFF